MKIRVSKDFIENWHCQIAQYILLTVPAQDIRLS